MIFLTEPEDQILLKATMNPEEFKIAAFVCWWNNGSSCPWFFPLHCMLRWPSFSLFGSWILSSAPRWSLHQLLWTGFLLKYKGYDTHKNITMSSLVEMALLHRSWVLWMTVYSWMFPTIWISFASTLSAQLPVRLRNPMALRLTLKLC